MERNTRELSIWEQKPHSNNRQATAWTMTTTDCSGLCCELIESSKLVDHSIEPLKIGWFAFSLFLSVSYNHIVFSGACLCCLNNSRVIPNGNEEQNEWLLFRYHLHIDLNSIKNMWNRNHFLCYSPHTHTHKITDSKCVLHHWKFPKHVKWFGRLFANMEEK